MRKSESSTVIGIRLPFKEFFYWNSYCKFTGQSISEFIEDTMNAFLNYSLFTPLYDKAIVEGIKASYTVLTPEKKLKPVTFRVKNSQLKRWNLHSARLKITRTALIRQAVTFYFDENPNEIPKPDALEITRIMDTVLNLIKEMGLMDFHKIRAIFNGVDEWLLVDILNSLEKQQKLGRKGMDKYIATTSSSYSDIDSMWVAELLSIVNEMITRPEEYDIEKIIPISMDEELFDGKEVAIKALIARVFEFLQITLDNAQKLVEDELDPVEMGNLKHSGKQKITELLSIFSSLYQVPFLKRIK